MKERKWEERNGEREGGVSEGEMRRVSERERDGGVSG